MSSAPERSPATEPPGFGFVVPLEANAYGDLFIPPDATADAMTGDRVLAKATRKGVREGQDRYTGEILEVLERANNQFVGTLIRHPESWIVQPDGSGFVEPITVEDVTAKNARENDKVVVEILSYPTERLLAPKSLRSSASSPCPASSSRTAWSKLVPRLRDLPRTRPRIAKTSAARSS